MATKVHAQMAPMRTITKRGASGEGGGKRDDGGGEERGGERGRKSRRRGCGANSAIDSTNHSGRGGAEDSKALAGSDAIRFGCDS